MKKIFCLFIAINIIASCTKDISSFNEETKQAANVPAGTLFSNAVRNVSDALASASVNTNPLRFTIKHWAMAVYQDEAQYDFSTRNIPQSWWTIMYRDVLNDLKESGRIVDENMSSAFDPVVKSNQLAIVDIMEIYVYNILVNTFGNVPYTEALDPENLFPKYDDAKTVYADLLSRLANDIGKLDPSKGGFSASEDRVFGGDVAQWKKFASSLLLKMGMIIADVDETVAKSTVETTDAGAMASADDDAAFTYLTATPNTNPLYADIVLGGRGDYVAAEDLMNVLIDLNDPRKENFFGTNNAGQYQGGVVGTVNTYADMSKPSAAVSAADAPLVLLDFIETEFYRAEAIERGFNVAGTAEEHYNNAIKASILFWGGTETDADDYLAQPEVAYSTAPGTWKQKIAFQKWIALYNRPFEGWIEYRRLDYPVLPLAVGAAVGFPNRYQYPNNEQQLNGTNYTSAAQAIGGDEVETKLWWDKF